MPDNQPTPAPANAVDAQTARVSDRTVEGSETRVDEISGRILGPGEQSLREQHPNTKPAPNDTTRPESAAGIGGDQSLREGAPPPEGENDYGTAVDAGQQINEGDSAESINPGSTNATN